jgi:hypothetical protein
MRKACDKWSQGIHQFLATKHIPTLEHALYWPDLALCDIFLSTELKSSLKGTHLQSTEGNHNKRQSHLKHFHKMASESHYGAMDIINCHFKYQVTLWDQTQNRQDKDSSRIKPKVKGSS